jgi:hypothetical protein
MAPLASAVQMNQFNLDLRRLMRAVSNHLRTRVGAGDLWIGISGIFLTIQAKRN